MRRIVLALAVLGLVVGSVTLASATHYPELCVHGFDDIPWDGNAQNNTKTFHDPGSAPGWCAAAQEGDDNYYFNDASSSDTGYGGGGSDVLEGGPSFDWLIGGGQTDYLRGEDGNDAIYDGPGADVLTPGAGTDTWYRCQDGVNDTVVGTFETETSITDANCDGPF